MKRVIIAILLMFLGLYWFSVHFRTNAGNTILHLASKYRLTMVLRCALLFGANPNVTNNIKDTPLHIAVKYGHKSMGPLVDACKVDDNPLDSLYGEASAEVRGKLPEIDFSQDFDEGQLQAITLLLCYGADINLRNVHGMSPSDYAIELGNIAIAKRFFMLGAIPNLDRTANVIDVSTRANDIYFWILVTMNRCGCIYDPRAKFCQNILQFALDLNLWNSVMYFLMYHVITRSPEMPMLFFDLLSHYVGLRQYHDSDFPKLKLKYEK